MTLHNCLPFTFFYVCRCGYRSFELHFLDQGTVCFMHANSSNFTIAALSKILLHCGEVTSKWILLCTNGLYIYNILEAFFLYLHRQLCGHHQKRHKINTSSRVGLLPLERKVPTQSKKGNLWSFFSAAVTTFQQRKFKETPDFKKRGTFFFSLFRQNFL